VRVETIEVQPDLITAVSIFEDELPKFLDDMKKSNHAPGKTYALFKQCPEGTPSVPYWTWAYDPSGKLLIIDTPAKKSEAAPPWFEKELDIAFPPCSFVLEHQGTPTIFNLSGQTQQTVHQGKPEDGPALAKEWRAKTSLNPVPGTYSLIQSCPQELGGSKLIDQWSF
jgi:hypothetical protein